ncbi:MAG: shikimate dehydrogenase [Candidatus Promineofilum sp.]|nr:shikimate dehydrogenase [Promineifilum sp.]
MIDGNTQLIGLIGYPVAHTLSPMMHNAAAAALGLNVRYVPLPVAPERLPDALRGLSALGFRGVNVTVPHKEAVLSQLDAIFPAARVIGAVNTIVIGHGRLTGFNTDWSGFLSDLERYRLALYGRDCLVLGAGGSARAVVYALLRRGCRVTIVARRPEQAQRLAAELGAAFPKAMPPEIGLLDDAARLAALLDEPILINTTPLGMEGQFSEHSPWPEDAPFPPGAFAYDLVYAPRETNFMAQARAAGRQTANGLGMLVGQAAEAFEILTAHRPDPAVMWRAIGDFPQISPTPMEYP